MQKKDGLHGRGGKNMSVLISGGSGLVGANLARYFARQGRKTVIYDIVTKVPSFLDEFVSKGEVILVRGDILDFGKILRTLREYEVTQVVHMAALLAEPESKDRPLQFSTVNIQGTMIILEACRYFRMERFIYVSTRSIYGEYLPEEGPIGEEFIFRPVAFYGATKCAADLLARTYRKVYDFDVSCVRITGVYGPGQTYPHPLYNFLKNALEGGEVVQEKGGDYLYEFTYVHDVVRGLVKLLDAPSLKHDAYNLATGSQVTLREVGEAVARAVPGSSIKVGPGLPAGAIPRAALDITRIKEELGFGPVYDLNCGVTLFAKYLREGYYEDIAGD